MSSVLGLAMTGGAGTTGVRVILGAQLRALFKLVGRRIPDRREHLGLGAEVLLGIVVAVEAPLHLQGLGLIDEGHLPDRPVASGAADALVHVRRVIEVG